MVLLGLLLIFLLFFRKTLGPALTWSAAALGLGAFILRPFLKVTPEKIEARGLKSLRPRFTVPVVTDNIARVVPEPSKQNNPLTTYGAATAARGDVAAGVAKMVLGGILSAIASAWEERSLNRKLPQIKEQMIAEIDASLSTWNDRITSMTSFSALKAAEMRGTLLGQIDDVMRVYHRQLKYLARRQKESRKLAENELQAVRQARSQVSSAVERTNAFLDRSFAS